MERWLWDPALLSSSAALLPETGNLWTLRTAKNVGTCAVRQALTRPFRDLLLPSPGTWQVHCESLAMQASLGLLMVLWNYAVAQGSPVGGAMPQ